MLEAVHLLLGLDLFVVVVSVDSRWMLRALEVHYSELLTANGEMNGRGFRQSTPQNYLEKIFQIPFALAPMSETGFKNYVQFLVRDGAERVRDIEPGSGTQSKAASTSGEKQADRAKLVGDAPLLSLPPGDAMAALDSYLGQLDRSLTAPFVFGDAPSIADFSIYHCLWFIDNPANAKFINPYPNVRGWLSRLAGFGHGSVSEASAADALAHSKASEPVLAAELTDAAPLRLPGVALGDFVTVTPTDYGQIPVTGRLVAATAAELVLERDDTDAGRLLTHFPNIGFTLATG